jgi:cytochrome c-type biogenesis protein CcmH
MTSTILNNLAPASLPVVVAATLLAAALAFLAILWIRLGQKSDVVADTTDLAAEQIGLLQAERGRLDAAMSNGTLTAAEHERACLELDRRLLALSRQMDSPSPAPSARPVYWTLGLVVPATALAIYLVLGSPQSPDRPHAARTDEIAAAKSTAEASQNAGAEAFRAALGATEENPRDIETWLDLAEAAAAVGDMETEIRALRTALDLTNKDPAIMSMLAEALSRAADGQVTVPARDLVNTVLAVNPEEPRALFLAGLAHFQDGDYANAISRWQRLLAISKPDAPWVGLVRENIARAAEAGNIALDSRQPGPDAAALADAANMTADERAEMINSMVSRLERKLDENPNDVEGWLRLARAYDVMEQPARALFALSQAAAVAPDNLDLQFGVLEHILQSGTTAQELARAETALGNAAAVAPDHPQTLFFKGHVARTRGDTAAARSAWQALLAKMPADSEMAKALSAEIDKLD